MWSCRLALLTLLLLLPLTPASAQKNFGFDNRKPSGQPYLTPEESVKRFQLPPGWEITVFAAEPDIINPVAFTVDERGRLWVVECFEYPRRTPKGQLPRDRIKILEDTKGTGKADKITTWVDSKEWPFRFDLATGIEVGNGGVYLGAAPYLLFLQDKAGKGKCDTFDILLKGFGSQDTHETLNTFQWGPDSKLYGLHGIFTNSDVDGVKMNAAVWRYDAPAKKFDIFAEGTSNPWGMDFDSRGQCYLACCVIPHLFHMVPGGTYKRQAGGSNNPYAYGLLNEICDHIHHKESGWAHAGLLFLEGYGMPEEYRGSMIMGSIHGCSIKRDTLRPNGSSFIAGHAPDFAVSGDKNFRPINMRYGPDGAIYVIDWHDQNPCHQAPPDSWDMTHGRIYRIARKATPPQKPTNAAEQTTKGLVELLNVDNPYWHRTALRLLHERRDQSVAPELLKIAMIEQGNEAVPLRALWGLYAVGAFNEDVAAKLLTHRSPWMRSWVVRLLGESNAVSDRMLAKFTEMAQKDPAAPVRLQLASTAARLKKQDTLPLLHNLMMHREDAKDTMLPLMIWLAYEPRVAAQQRPTLDWLKENAPGNALVLNDILPRAVRRLVATNKDADLAAVIAFLADLRDAEARRQTLTALADALKDRQLTAPPQWKTLFPQLVKDADAKVQQLARKLAVNFQDPEAVRRALAVALDRAKKAAERIDAIRDLEVARPKEAFGPLQELVRNDSNLDIRVQACRALAGYDRQELAMSLLHDWKTFPPPLRSEAVNLLSSRKPWAKDLLTAVGIKQVARTDLTDNVIVRIRAFGDKNLNEQIEKVWGRFRDTPKELNALIDRMRGEMYMGEASYARGRKVFEAQCSKCHKFDGTGHEVGPQLDGAARDIEYLLVNVLDPNRVVGQPYYMRTVVLLDGKLESGILHAEDAQSITLKMENNVLKTIQKKDIDGKVQVQEKSLMPEGLANNMTVQDFRDLVRYTMAHPFLTHVEIFDTTKNLDPVTWTAGTKNHGLVGSRYAAGVAGRIPLTISKAPARKRFVLATVNAPEAMKTRLQLGSGADLRVWFNGKLVYTGRPGSGPAEPDQVGLEVELRAGENRLVFEAAYSGDNHALYARFLDPNRRLTYPEP
jgi:putative membrane-bound dehydrogenase-like protein